MALSKGAGPNRRVAVVSEQFGSANFPITVGIDSAGTVSGGNAFELPTREITVPENDIAFWTIHNSDTTEIEDGPQGHDQRIINWVSGRYSGKRTVSLHGFRLVSGFPGRIYDWHCQPDDPGGGWEPPGSNGVAPVAIDYRNDNDGLLLIFQPEETASGIIHYQILTQSEMEALRGDWVWIWLDMTWGRDTGGGTAYLHTEDSPRVDISDIHTHWNTQTQITFWEGAYESTTMAQDCVIEVASTRFGLTPQECYEDTPEFYVAEPAGSAGGTSQEIAGRSSTEAEIPSPLAW